MFNIEQNVQSDAFSNSKENRLRTRISIYAISFLVVILFVSSSPLAFTQAEGGGFSQAYMFRTPGGRAGGMSGAFTAVVNDPYAIFYNPAGLSFLEFNPAVSTSVQTSGFGKSYSTLVYGQEVMENLGIGVGITSFNGGSFTARDYQGNPYGQMTDMHFSGNLAMSYSMEFLSMGVNMKYLNNTLVSSDLSSHGFGLDVGLKANVNFGSYGSYSLGAAVQNIGGMMLWDGYFSETDLLPYCIRVGVGMELGLNGSDYETRNEITGELEEVSEASTRYILVGIDAIMHQFDKEPTIVMGFDAVVHEVFSIRGGIALYGANEGKSGFFPMTIWSGGFAIRPNVRNFGMPVDLSIEYTIAKEYVSYSGVGHQMTLMFSF